MFSQFAEKKLTTANILQSNAFLSLASKILRGKTIEASDLIGTTFEQNQPDLVNPRLLRMELYRAAIAINPNAYIAMTNLAICISQGAPLQDDDLQYTRFRRDTPLSEVDANEAVADLYRSSIKTNPAHTMAICNLATCFQRRAIPLQTDFLGTKFERKSLQNVPLNDLIIALYRKARRLNPQDPIANYMVGTAILHGANIEEEDLSFTNLQNQAIEDVSNIELAAEILRNFIELNFDDYHPLYSEALSMLGFCLLEGAPVTDRDLLHTGFPTDLPETSVPVEVAHALYSEILTFYPTHETAIAQLSLCEEFLRQMRALEIQLIEMGAILEPRPSYTPQFTTSHVQEVCEETNSLEEISKKSYTL